MARTKKKSTPSLAGQTDPRAPIDGAAFLKAAQPVLELLTKDLLERVDASAAVGRAMRAQHGKELGAKRTADAYEQWRRQVVVQIAASWLLSCVFVRTLEDRGLVAQARIAGPGATDAQETFFAVAPFLTERDYLRAVFTELEHVPVCAALFDREHNLAWRLAPSAAATKELLGLFRTPTAEAPAFRFGQASTRFLGDLYQDLSEDVRKRFALLQTPEFVESFILDRTLDPAIAEFGLDETTVIDPTCGSGHFLLGAFARLFEAWSIKEPGASVESAVSKALAGVYGVDVNPYAVSIARFRLTLAALEKLGVSQLSAAPGLTLNVVVADSLLHGGAQDSGRQRDFGDLEEQRGAVWRDEMFALDDEVGAKRTLGGRGGLGHAAVVGNPPYITVKDEALREVYRGRYPSAKGTYSLSVPFMERFFGLARTGGFAGQITANSFMKRDFGRSLVEQFLPSVDLTLIVNTAGAYIPGHGTPTVIVFGRRRAPESTRLPVVLARRGEPSTPDEPADGLVWRSIVDHTEEIGFENDFVTVEMVERAKLAKHPWSLEGGGAAELKALLEARASKTLRDVVDGSIGRAARTGGDEVFMMDPATATRIGVPSGWMRPAIVGEIVRDWTLATDEVMVFPYSNTATHAAMDLDERGEAARLYRYLWPLRTTLWGRATFQGTMRDAGKRWYEYMQYTASANTPPLSITFAFVSTHNHFVFDRGGKVFKQTAPIIKLPASATEDDHLALLAYLNSSTACFWMKQVAQARTITTGEKILQSDPAKLAYEFAGTHLEQLPVPAFKRRDLLILLARELDQAARQRQSLPAQSVAAIVAGDGANETLAANESLGDELARRCVLLQELCDLLAYNDYGLITLSSLQLAEVERLAQDPSAALDLEQRSSSGCDDVSATAGWDGLHPLFREGAVAAIEQPSFKRRWIGTQGRFQGAGASWREKVRQGATAELLSHVEAMFTDYEPLDAAELAARLTLDPSVA